MMPWLQIDGDAVASIWRVVIVEGQQASTLIYDDVTANPCSSQASVPPVMLRTFW